MSYPVPGALILITLLLGLLTGLLAFGLLPLRIRHAEWPFARRHENIILGLMLLAAFIFGVFITILLR